MLVGSLLAAAASCAPAPVASSAVAGLPAYGPEESTWFDDSLVPAVLGLPPEIPPEQDTKLPQRRRLADAVVRARVSTVTHEALASQSGYQISLRIEDTLSGHFDGTTLELRIGRSSPAVARLNETEDAVVGKRWLVFLRRYSDGGEPVLHWHAEADDEPTRKALDQAKTLDEVQSRGQTPR